MHCKILTRKVLLSCFFLLMFAIKPGFGKLNLQNGNTTINGFTRLADEKIQNFKKEKYGFELHCACATAKEADIYVEESRGLVSTEFIE